MVHYASALIPQAAGTHSSGINVPGVGTSVMRLFNVAAVTLFGSALLCASGLTIPNSDFETPNITTGFGGCSGSPTGGIYIYNPTGCGQSWTFVGGSGLTHTPSAFNNPAGPDGSSQSAFLQNIGNFSQTIT